MRANYIDGQADWLTDWLAGGRYRRKVLIYIGIVFFLKGFVLFWVRIVLKGSEIVFFLNMGEGESFTNIDNIYKVKELLNIYYFFIVGGSEELKVLGLEL